MRQIAPCPRYCALAVLPAVAVGDYAEAIEAVCAKAVPGCAVVTMGARDPDLPKLARGILERVGNSIR